MSLGLYLAFLAASTVLIIMPGPVVALVVANSLAHGRRYGLITVMGAAAATVIHLTATFFGMASLLAAAGGWFEWLRWVGVAYLVVLAILAFRAPGEDLDVASAQPRSSREIFLRGFAISLTNPKTLLFYGAFFPQFLTRTTPLAPQLALMCVSFLVIAVASDSLWAIAAGRLRGVLNGRGKLRNRLSGGIYLLAGAGLAGIRQG